MGLKKDANAQHRILYSINKKKPEHAYSAEMIREDLGKLFELLDEGKIEPVIAKKMRLEDAARAHELVENAALAGKIVLVANEG